MANYYGQWRTNYFKVKDKRKFLEWAKTIPDTEAQVTKKGCMLMMSDDTDSGSIPNCRAGEDQTDTVDFDLLEELAPHLANKEVAVIMESGSEKMRYLIGYAGAINNIGKRIDISIQDIYKLAGKLGKNISGCEY